LISHGASLSFHVAPASLFLDDSDGMNFCHRREIRRHVVRQAMPLKVERANRVSGQSRQVGRLADCVSTQVGAFA
jgi:hypothetical protein